MFRYDLFKTEVIFHKYKYFKGHSFHSFEEHFPPYYTVDTENLIFPITVVDKPVFKTLTIKNTVDSYPIVFNVDPTLFKYFLL